MTDTTLTITTPDGTTTGPIDAAGLHRAARALTGTPPMRDSAADTAVRDRVYGIAAAELLAFIERVERLEEERREIAEQVKEVMAEAKGRGYDTKILRKVIALRKRDADDIAEETALLDLYLSALGMAR